MTESEAIVALGVAVSFIAGFLTGYLKRGGKK